MADLQLKRHGVSTYSNSGNTADTLCIEADELDWDTNYGGDPISHSISLDKEDAIKLAHWILTEYMD